MPSWGRGKVDGAEAETDSGGMVVGYMASLSREQEAVRPPLFRFSIFDFDLRFFSAPPRLCARTTPAVPSLTFDRRYAGMDLP